MYEASSHYHEADAKAAWAALEAAEAEYKAKLVWAEIAQGNDYY